MSFWQVVTDASGFSGEWVMFNSVEVSIKRVVSVGGWCPNAFGVEGVRLVISCEVMLIIIYVAYRKLGFL